MKRTGEPLWRWPIWKEEKIAEGPLKLDEALDILTRFAEQTDQLRILTLLPTAVKKIALFRSA